MMERVHPIFLLPGEVELIIAMLGMVGQLNVGESKANNLLLKIVWSDIAVK